MTDMTERLVAARDRLKPLTRQGEDCIWRPAKEAHEVMADAANRITALEAENIRLSRQIGELVGALRHMVAAYEDLPGAQTAPGSWCSHARAVLDAVKQEGDRT